MKIAFCLAVFLLATGSHPLVAASKDKPASAAAAEITFSQQRGFYDVPFALKLSAADASAEIRFTTDGTTPTASNGAPYLKPISIKQTSTIRAAVIKPGGKASRAATHTFIFPQDVITQSSDGLPPPGFYYTWGANKVDYGMDPKVVNDPKYRKEIIADLKSIPTFSLVMDQADLFDKQRGIYANAQQHGRDVERPASVELIYPDGRQGFQINSGVRIRGGFSRMPNNPRHSFRLFFRKEYGTGKLNFPVFGPDAAQSFDGFDLRTAQNYSWSLGRDPRAVFLRDQFSRDTQLAMGQASAHGDFCHLYINGQYWGLYDTCERPEASFAASYFGGEKQDYDVLKPRGGPGGGGVGSTGDAPFSTDGNADAWKRLWDLAKAGFGKNENYQKALGHDPDGTRNPKYEVLLDPINLIDYMLVIYYGGNMDSPISKFGGNNMPNNWYGSRNRKGNEGFRFFVWDAEHTLLDLDEDRTGPYPCGDSFGQSNPQWLLQRCLESAEFRLLFADRVHRHFDNGGVLSPETCEARFTKRTKEIEGAVVCESARWGDVEGGGWGGPPPGARNNSGPMTRDVEWRAEVKRIMTEFFPERTEVVREQFWNLGLIPDLAPPSFSQHGGAIDASFKLAMKAAEGTIYYTTDGSDPRLLGGKTSPSAQTYSATVPVKDGTLIKARALHKGEWSPITEATFGSVAKSK